VLDVLDFYTESKGQTDVWSKFNHNQKLPSKPEKDLTPVNFFFSLFKNKTKQ